MAGYIIGMILVIALVVVFTYVFFWNLVSLVLNLALIYVVCMRVYFMWQKNRIKHYAIGMGASLLLVLIFGALLPLWKVTSFLIIGAIIAEIIYWYPKLYKPHRKRRKRRRKK